ncbi:MAG: GMC oxidoreductase, partial [Bacteroidota bacterium]
LVYFGKLVELFVEACVEKGIPRNPDFNGEKQEGAGFCQFTIKNGKRNSTAVAFLRPVLDRPNLTVITGAHTHKVIIENQAAKGIVYSQGKSLKEVYAAKEVILSAGAFNSPQILMLSGIGPAEELKKHQIEVQVDLPGVGQNLQDHLFYLTCSMSKQAWGGNHYTKPQHMLAAAANYLFRRKGILCASPLEGMAFVKLPTATDRPNLQIHFVPLQLHNYDVDIYSPNQFSGQDGFSILPTLLKPKSRGWIKLRSNQAQDKPIIQPNFLEAKEDRQLLLDGFHLAMELHGTKVFKEHIQKTHFPKPGLKDEKAIFKHIHQALHTVYHPVGTCKMGDDEMAVVDAELKVHGIEGLRVVDGSIMPTIVSGNTNAPIIMIG